MNKINFKFIVILFLLYPFLVFSSESISYGYDIKNRIIAINYADGSTVDYVYDNMGNRLLKTTTSPNSGENQPPDGMIPTPASDATDIETRPTLTWSNSLDPNGDSIVYYLYLGTNTTFLPLTYSSTNNNFQLEGYCLEPATTYYWKVIARDSYNAEYQTPVWNFTTRTTHTSDDELCSVTYADFDGDGIENGLDYFPYKLTRLSDGLDNNSLAWNTFGDTNWGVRGGVETHDGVDSVRSGQITHSQNTQLELFT